MAIVMGLQMIGNNDTGSNVSQSGQGGWLDTVPKGAIHIECVVNGPVETNTYFVCSRDEAVVIDPAWEGERLAREFVQNHPSVKIKALVCTHGHGDHVGGVAGMRRVLGDVPFLISRDDAAFVPGAIEGMREMWGIETEDPGAPTRLLAEGDTVEFGGSSLQVIETPGHTPGGIVLFAATETGNVAFVGDTLFPGGHGRVDLEGGSASQIIRSLGKMATVLPEDTLCLIGHGATTTIADERAGNLFMRRGMSRV